MTGDYAGLDDESRICILSPCASADKGRSVWAEISANLEAAIREELPAPEDQSAPELLDADAYRKLVQG
jgi:hypothetical protein